MKDNELIKKWLDNSLSEEEQKAFEQTEDYRFLSKLTDALEHFKAPEYRVESELERQYAQRQPAARRRWLAPLLKVAAVLLLIGGLSYWFISEGPSTSSPPIRISAEDQKEISLPDASLVTLNKHSTLRYEKEKWTENREVQLNGEAYFEVASGKQFDVHTVHGTVTVIGTRFNVKDRKGYFEVTCYEGKVAVVTAFAAKMELTAGEQYRVINGEEQPQVTADASSPSWMENMSTFVSVPVIEVLREFERQYDVTVRYNRLDTSRLYTGSFTHSDRLVALKSITIPLDLTYRIDQDNIILME